MSKELEALERLVDDVLDIRHYYKQFSSSTPIIMQDKQLIENALKRLDKIDNEPVVPIHIDRYNELSDKEDVLEIIKSFNDYQIVEVQGQWYLMRGIEFGKSIKMPITKEQADLLKEML